MRRHTRMRWPVCAALGVAAVVALACGQPSTPRNVVLITIDTLRADHTSAYGYGLPTTPFLEAVAGAGLRVEHAYAPMPTTLPSHATMLTSKPPIVHGSLRNGLVLSSEHTLLSEVLRDHGYQTAAFVSSFALNGRVGLSDGFDVYDDDFTDGLPVSESAPSHREGGQTTERATRWLESHAQDGPFFLWVHYFDPHSPYDPPTPFLEDYLTESWPKGDLRRVHALYDGDVAYTDWAMGRLVDRLDELVPQDDTLLIITADHGEGLADHGFVGHGPILYEETLRIPLVFRWPGSIPAGVTLAGPVGLGDLMPTILRLVDIDADELALQGQDLSDALLSGSADLDDRTLVFQRRSYESRRVRSIRVEGATVGTSLRVSGDKFALLRRPWKYIVSVEEDTRELYDLSTDPRESTNVVDQQEAVADDFDEALSDWLSEQAARGLGRSLEVSEEQLRRLRSLGYVR